MLLRAAADRFIIIISSVIQLHIIMQQMFQRTGVIKSDRRLVWSCSSGPPLASGPWFLQRPTCQRRVHREGRRSHYSYNEIIMNGAPRPHHRNIYCIIYSAGPLVQGERTHINFQPRSSPPHSSSCLLLKAEVPLARSLALFLSFLLFFSFFLLCCFFFRDAARGASTGAPRPSRSGLPAVDAPHLPSSLFFYLLSCFSLFFCCFFSYSWSNSFFTKGLQTRTNWDLWDLWDSCAVFQRHALTDVINVWSAKI